jgi:hypothetical protein
VTRFAFFQRALPHLVACALLGALLGGGCSISVDPLEAWTMTLHRVESCSVVGEGQQNCVPDDELASQTTKGRWVFEHGPDQSFQVTLHDGASYSGIYFSDDGRTLTTEAPPCTGNGEGLCYFARNRSSSIDDNDNGCARTSEYLIVARLTEVDESEAAGGRKLEASISSRTLVDDNCQAPAFTEVIDTGTGVFDPDHVSLAQAEAKPAEAK